MGIAPYDSVALIIEKYFKKREYSFQYARVMSDVCLCHYRGSVSVLPAGNNLWMIVGIGYALSMHFATDL